MADTQAEPVIVLDDIHKAFGPLHVLRGISLQVQRGETLVMIGQSGTGKSVSMRIMIGLLEPDRGRALYEGRDVHRMNTAELADMRADFAMLFQGGALFDSMTVGENVGFGFETRGGKSPEEVRGIVSRTLGMVGLPGIEEKMPAELSGGMKKRVALARAIATQPSVVLYDEPTTGLDPIMSDVIADLIIETRDSLTEKEITSIVVTHDMHVALKTADRIIMLHQGRIVGEGTPDLFNELRDRVDATGLDEQEQMIRQFVRGEADGPIQATL